MAGNVATESPAAFPPAASSTPTGGAGDRTIVTRLIQYTVSSRVVAVRTVSYTVLSAVKAVPTTAAPFVPLTAGDCCPNVTPDTVFRRLVVDNRVIGGTVVRWDLDPDFDEAGPYAWQLQVSKSGVPDSDDWTNVGPVVLDAAYLVDPDQQTWGVGEIIHYRVILATADGTHTSYGAHPDTILPEHDWLLAQEIIRKERLRQAVAAGVPGYLLKARRYGVRCDCVNAVTRERENSSCLRCYGVGYVGGYHPPVRCAFAEMPPSDSRQQTSYAEGRGITQENLFRVRQLPGIPIVQEDAWIADGDDARYKVHRVWEMAMHRGVTLAYGIELRRVPRRDVLYRVPVARVGGCDWGTSVEDSTPETICLPTETCL